MMLSDLLTGANPAASWTLALILLVVVSAVVGLLLHLIAQTAMGIEAAVAEVWEGGQRVANNTIHIAVLHRIAENVEAILKRAGGIAGSAAAIRSHAETCPGCPDCFLKRG
jgi:Na+/H+ antiporter NhaC